MLTCYLYIWIERETNRDRCTVLWLGFNFYGAANEKEPMLDAETA